MLKYIAVLATITSIWPAFAQESVRVDWVGKKVLSQPSTVQKATSVTVTVENVNDVFYTYSISSTSTPAQIDDFNNIAKAFSIAGLASKGAGEAASCDDSAFLQSIKDLTDAENAFLNLPSTKTGCSVSSPCSVPLSDAKQAWTSVQPKLEAAKSAQKALQTLCTAAEYQSAYQTSQHALDQGDQIASSFNNNTHEAKSQLTIKPDYVTTLEVDEFWKGTPTSKGQYSVTLSNSNSRLTLSAGALFSEVQNRSYKSVAAPNSSGTGTMNILQVSGQSLFTPTALALLNYEIPKASTDTIGWAVSTGPVLRLGSKSDTSSFGYFAGLSIHLYHRFYTSAGFHFGEFAGFPVGFSQQGQTIPSGIGTPSPVNRWTWRFGFAFTYKAKDFSSFGLSATTSPSTNKQQSSPTNPTKPAPSGTTPGKQQTPSGSGSN